MSQDAIDLDGDGIPDSIDREVLTPQPGAEPPEDKKEKGSQNPIAKESVPSVKEDAKTKKPKDIRVPVPRKPDVDDPEPPQLLRTVNLLPIPACPVKTPSDYEGIAKFIIERAHQGIADIFAHPSYNQCAKNPCEDVARAVAEYQTGIPYSMPIYFYDVKNSQKTVCRQLVEEGRVPLAGQCQQSVTSALCIGGWDGNLSSKYACGDIGSGIDAAPGVKAMGGRKWEPEDVSSWLKGWKDALWNDVPVGTALFWSAPPCTRKDIKHVWISESAIQEERDRLGQNGTIKVKKPQWNPQKNKSEMVEVEVPNWVIGPVQETALHIKACGSGSGHVAMILRKHPKQKKIQLWDTCGHGNQKMKKAVPSGIGPDSSSCLYEGVWADSFAGSLAGGGTTWGFRGLALVPVFGTVRKPLKPRGMCRLLLRRRGDGELLYRSEWIDMEKEHLPISWLLRSLRGAPFCDIIEPTWCVNGKYDDPEKAAKGPAPAIMDAKCDASGNAYLHAKMKDRINNRPKPQDWKPEGKFVSDGKTTASGAGVASGPLSSVELCGNKILQAIAGGSGGKIAKGQKDSPAVKCVQAALVKLGHLADPKGKAADGDFGGGTEGALKSFQKSAGLPETGVIDKATLLALEQALLGAPAAAAS